MISCNVQATGTVTSGAMLRKNSDGAKFSTFNMRVSLADKSGSPYCIELSVSCAPIENLLSYREGTRVSIAGTLRIRKVENNVYLNVKASELSLDCPGKDSISCEMDFRGKVGKSVNSREDKNGRPFYSFSAYSSDTYGDERTYTWIDFIMFSESPGEWFAPAAFISVTGPVEFTVYKGQIKMSCIVRNIERWEMPAKN